jgi:hypothetical protein
MNFSKYLIFCFAIFFTSKTFCQVIEVEPLSKGLFGTTNTMTMLYESNNAEITLIVILGYPGKVGLKAGDVGIQQQTAIMMRNFSYQGKVKSNVVILDSPYFLQDLTARSNSDHLGRIESVIKFYGNRFKLPVWLFGHSDGSISVSEFLNRSENNRKLLAGAILSGGRDETRISEDWKLPTLVIHHEKDACRFTTFWGAKQYFALIKKKNSKPTEFAEITLGFDYSDPCSTGTHMYEGAYSEATHYIGDFIYRYSGTCFPDGALASKCSPKEYQQIKLSPSLNLTNEPDEPLIELSAPN